MTTAGACVPAFNTTPALGLLHPPACPAVVASCLPNLAPRPTSLCSPLDPESRSRCDCSPYYDTQPGRQPACQRDFLNRLAALEAAAASTSE